MKILSKDLRKGFIKLEPEHTEDLWYLSQVIDQGDLAKARTLRKIKLGSEGDRNQKVIRKPVWLELKVEKAELQSDSLRVSGTITEGPEDIPNGSHHTFSVEPFTEITLTKERWLSFQLDLMKESVESRQAHILLIVMDREEAFFARLKKSGYEFVSMLKGNVQKKRVDEKISGNFYKEIEDAIAEMETRAPFETIIVASPSFWKEDLMKGVSPDLRKRMVPATCGSVGMTAFDELLRRDEVRSALRKDKVTKEIGKVEELLENISKDGNAVYGMAETGAAADAGAIACILVTDSLIQKARDEGWYHKLDAILKAVDSAGGEIVMVSRAHEGGKKLDGLGGIGAITRYKMNR